MEQFKTEIDWYFALNEHDLLLNADDDLIWFDLIFVIDVLFYYSCFFQE